MASWPGCCCVQRRGGGVGRGVRCGAPVCSTTTWPRVVGAERAEAVVVLQFVGDTVVAWPAEARLGVPQQRHGGGRPGGSLALARLRCHGGAAGFAKLGWRLQICPRLCERRCGWR